MILTNLDPNTGLPNIKETRTNKPWRALPRDISKKAEELDAQEEGTLWYPCHHEYMDGILQRVRCWKCGTDLKAWRMALDGTGNPIEIDGRPAVAFLPLPNLMQTPISVYLPKLDKKIFFSVQHCGDCLITNQHLFESMTCLLAAMDKNLASAWAMGSVSLIRPDTWATYLYRWSGAEPVSVAKMEDIKMNERVPAPGELLTAAQYAIDMDLARRNAVPCGTIVEYNGSKLPLGWKEIQGRKRFIEKL